MIAFKVLVLIIEMTTIMWCFLATIISSTGVGDGTVRRRDALLIHDHFQYTYMLLDYIYSNKRVSHWMKHRLDDTRLLRLCRSASVTMAGIRRCLRKYGNSVVWENGKKLPIWLALYGHHLVPTIPQWICDSLLQTNMWYLSPDKHVIAIWR